MLKQNQEKLIRRLERRKKKLEAELQTVEAELERVSALPVLPDKMTAAWIRRQKVYELRVKGLPFKTIAKLMKCRAPEAKHDYMRYEDHYAPLCLLTLRRDGEVFSTVSRFFSIESARDAYADTKGFPGAEVLEFQQYKPLIWDSFYSDGGNQTEDGQYEIIREGRPGDISNYYAFHIPSRWESPIYTNEWDRGIERKWLLEYPGDTIELGDWSGGREGAKHAAEIHAVASWSEAKLVCVERIIPKKPSPFAVSMLPTFYIESH